MSLLARPRRLSVALAVLMMCPALFAAGAPIAGVYQDSSETPVFQYDKPGVKSKVGTDRRTYTLELNPDGTLRMSVTDTYGTGRRLYDRGVWAVHGGRLYFVKEAVLPRAEASDTERLGAMRVSMTHDGVEFSDVAVTAFGPAHMTRVTTGDLGGAVTAADVAALKTVLDRITGPVPRPPYAGVMSEAALKQIVHDAVATGNVEALMRVSYPLMSGIVADPQFNTYLTYMNSMAFAGIPRVMDKSAAEAAQSLAGMKRGAGCVFPDAVSPRGMFLIGRTSADGRSGSWGGFFYGVVDGHWALIGNPYDPTKAQAPRRQLRHD